MPDTPSFFVHEKADSDLEEIFDYSVERFGFSRAVNYVRAIEAMFNELASNPGSGKSFDPHRPHYLLKRVESHFIYYCVCENGIEVFRILHERMLPSRHLTGDFS
ncbi:type II toxin-antitoxin system RelE/ParE family toxin [Teredinibacter turnerae]|uniref:type II toxin-antitoxin system RelE/ParE family toxin n=1 Tax=Teredinibacter turnerae TaxID=2426 RepID=UPI00049061D0|nr:type II toxin-antitoxin system RelE/ParE family toxin [Teredinibacter turnerae]